MAWRAGVAWKALASPPEHRQPQVEAPDLPRHGQPGAGVAHVDAAILELVRTLNAHGFITTRSRQGDAARYAALPVWGRTHASAYIEFRSPYEGHAFAMLTAQLAGPDGVDVRLTSPRGASDDAAVMRVFFDPALIPSLARAWMRTGVPTPALPSA